MKVELINNKYYMSNMSNVTWNKDEHYCYYAFVNSK